MNNYEVEQPILNSPYKEPSEYWQIEAGRPPEIRSGRRQAGYFYRDPTHLSLLVSMRHGDDGNLLHV